MKNIFSKIESLKSDLNFLEKQKLDTIEFIKEKIYKAKLYLNSDLTISNTQKAKACIYLYDNTSYESWESCYEYPQLAKNYWAKENKLPEYFNYFKTDKFNVNNDYQDTHTNYIFELKFCKELFDPESISKDTWKKIVSEEKTLLGFDSFKKEMETKDNLEYLELLDKHLKYKLIKIDCPELELENWFYAIHERNYTSF